MSLSKYPEPFNPNPTPLIDGDRVIDRQGVTGTIRTNENLPNRPSQKWELVEYDTDITDQNGNKHNRTWVGNIWLKKI